MILKSTLMMVSVSILAIPSAFGQGAPMNLFPAKKSSAAKAISKVAPPPRVRDKNAADVVKNANRYFNGIRTMIASFDQIGADGRRTTGRLYIQKPGRLRFEYDSPAVLQVIADGRSVAIRNRKTAKQDLYLISQTPLKFLLKRRVDLTRDTKVMEVRSNEREAMVRIVDKATFGGTSRIRLYFDPKTFALRKWIVNDSQGYRTQVKLANVDLKSKPSPQLFRINYERLDTGQH